MRSYIFRAVRRLPDGTIGPTLDQRTIQADDDEAAIRAGRALDLDLATIGANAVYLSAADGRAIWSLHVPERPEEAGGDG